MKKLMVAVIAGCALSSGAHAACSAATIKGSFVAGLTGSYYATEPVAGIARLTFDGVNGITVTTYKEGYAGDVSTLSGSGTYTLDSLCRGNGSITLKQSGVVVGTNAMSFMVSGTAANPQIVALVSNPANDFTGVAYLSKISL